MSLLPKFTRRQALAASAAAAAAASGAGAVHLAGWWLGEPEGDYLFLAPDEVALADALAEALFPPGGHPALSGKDAGLARYLDGILAVMDPPTNEALRILLHALDDWAVLSSGSGYSKLDLEERTANLQRWLNHEQHLVRGAVTGLTIFLSMGYCGHPDVKAAAGWVFPCGFER